MVSGVEPGSIHDLTAAREHVLGALYKAAASGLPTLADSGYDGADIGILTPVKQPADAGLSTSTPAPATSSCAPCVAWANAASLCSPNAGAPSSTSLPAPAESATYP